jgi:hypothetical protein
MGRTQLVAGYLPYVESHTVIIPTFEIRYVGSQAPQKRNFGAHSRVALTQTQRLHLLQSTARDIYSHYCQVSNESSYEASGAVACATLSSVNPYS